MKTILVLVLLLNVVPGLAIAAEEAIPQKPVMTGNWKRITTMPDLGDLAGPQPLEEIHYEGLKVVRHLSED
ncbi:MAG: hypothetical protein WD049_03165, partial [Candidatus Paceibacterota bacterium]